MAYGFRSEDDCDAEDDCIDEGAKGEEVLRPTVEELPVDDKEELTPGSFNLAFLVL